MKYILYLLLLALLLSSCGGTALKDPSPDTVPVTETAEDTGEETIGTVEEMTALDGILSVEILPNSCTSAVSAYKITFEIDGLKRYFELALPCDYQTKEYPCVLYFPDVGHDINFLTDNFAKKGVIVAQLFYRGSKENEGTKDYCGKDYADAVKLLEICSSCGFLSHGGIFTAGAITGTTFALRLAADYPEMIAGCSVVDAIYDYEAFTEAVGENTRSHFLAVFGCTEDAFSAECAVRSPKSYYQNIKAPTLIFCYEESPFVPKEQSDALYEALTTNGCEAKLTYLNPANSDFNGTAFMELIPWIKKYSKK